MSAAISLQKQVNIGFLGPAGTFTHQAALKRFGDSVQYQEHSTIAEVLEAVISKRVTYGLVPLENSSYGSVSATLDAFTTYPSGFRIRAETFLNIEHSLLSNSQISNIRKIYSHEQVSIAHGRISALAHCFSR